MDDTLAVPASVGKYHPGVYDRLNSFFTARQQLARSYQHIVELGDVFLRHKLHERFGLALLHKRFDLFGDEYLVRTFQLRQGVVFKSPTPRRMYAIPCMWRAQRGPRGQWLFYPVEFVSYSELAERRADEFEQVGAFLIEMAEQLERFGVLDVFGIGTTGILALPCREDEILVETTNVRRRVLTVEAERRFDAGREELTETFWTFYPSGGAAPYTAMQCRIVSSAAGEAVSVSPFASTAFRATAAAAPASVVAAY